MYTNLTTDELFKLNTLYTREWLADKVDANKQAAVIATGAALTARGAW